MDKVSDFFESNIHFCFSYDFDLTNSIQKQSIRNTLKTDSFDWKSVDKRFFWNDYVTKDLQSNELNKWILPITDAFIFHEKYIQNEQLVSYVLISRRSCHNTGARYLTRGINRVGQVANFVETEQIIECNKQLSAFLIIRGSIPIFWHQSKFLVVFLK